MEKCDEPPMLLCIQVQSFFSINTNPMATGVVWDLFMSPSRQ